MWFLARWTSTYLMAPLRSGENKSSDGNTQLLSELSTNALLSFCGENDQGKAVLDIIIRISLSIFVSYPGEKDLQVSSLSSLYSCFHLKSKVIGQLKVDCTKPRNNTFI